MVHTLTIKVTPRAKKRRCKLDAEGRIHVYLISAPEKGAANAELLEYFAEVLNSARWRVTLVGGATSRIKRIAIETELTLDALYEKLGLHEAFQTKLG
jgi:uncharacterized protein YggU (UPF0235/DUF167 family)